MKNTTNFDIVPINPSLGYVPIETAEELAAPEMDFNVDWNKIHQTQIADDELNRLEDEASEVRKQRERYGMLN